MPRRLVREPRQPGDDYTFPEACRALRVSPTALRQYTKGPQPRIGHQKIGRHVTFSERHLAEFRLLHERSLSDGDRAELVGTILRHLDAMADLVGRTSRLGNADPSSLEGAVTALVLAIRNETSEHGRR